MGSRVAQTNSETALSPALSVLKAFPRWRPPLISNSLDQLFQQCLSANQSQRLSTVIGDAVAIVAQQQPKSSLASMSRHQASN